MAMEHRASQSEADLTFYTASLAQASTTHVPEVGSGAGPSLVAEVSRNAEGDRIIAGVAPPPYQS